MTDSSLDIMMMTVYSIEIEVKIFKVKVPKKIPLKSPKKTTQKTIP